MVASQNKVLRCISNKCVQNLYAENDKMMEKSKKNEINEEIFQV